MRVRIPYGPGHLDVELPAGARIGVPRRAPPLADAAAAIGAAIAAPLGTPPWVEVARGKRCASIAVPDATRPAFAHHVLPALLDALRGDVEIVVATGTHRAATPAEVESLVGARIAGAVPARSHDAFAGAHAHLGSLAAGVPVHIDAGFVAAEARVALGVVEPHVLAGYSGGAKTVCPGLAGIDTVRGVHRAALAAGRAGPGIAKGNAFRSEVEAVAERVGVHFSLQCVVTAAGELAHVAAGALVPAAARAVAFVEPHARIDLGGHHDVVVTTAGGWPLDRTLYQSVKGWLAALAAVRAGGDLLLVAELRDGLGSADFAALLASVGDEAALGRQIEDPQRFRRDQWMLQHVFQARARARLHIVSSLAPEGLRALGFEAHASVEAALAALVRPGRSLLVLPAGPAGVVAVNGQLVTLGGQLAGAA